MEVITNAVKIPLARSRAPERLPKKGFALFEAKPSLQAPGHQGGNTLCLPL
jgi:hypothetical protein